MDKNKVEDYYFGSKILKKQMVIDNIKKKRLRGIEHLKLDYIKAVSGIYKDRESFKKDLEGLMPGSFGIWFEFKLIQPYFSSDDDALYAVANPVMKEYISKLPMVRPSTWKGMLRSAAIYIIKNELVNADSIEKVLGYYLSAARIFGTGSQSFRQLKKYLADFISENGKDKDFVKSLIKYALFDLGIDISIQKDNQTTAVEQLAEQILRSAENNRHAVPIAVHKGRAIFYPTYFDALGFEIINPQNRNKRAGGDIAFYEVVPKNTEGIFQMLYTPHDAVIKSDEKIKEEVKTDFAFLKEIIEYVLKYRGIGAKTKLGWGRAEISGNIELICNRR